jgi:hypothetical protein
MNKSTTGLSRHNRANEIFTITVKRELTPPEATVALLMDIRDRLDILIHQGTEAQQAFATMRVSLDRTDRRLSGKIDSVFTKTNQRKGRHDLPTTD